MEWRLLMTGLVIFSAIAAAEDTDNNDEMDGQSSRKILGSSVVTSVSVVMETGNGKHTYYSDAVGHPLSKPHIASQVASPINLLNPDRYEFYTFNDEGELVKRLMTLQEIQGIIAGGDGEASNYNSEYHVDLYHPENDVSGVVENVQNVLKEEMEAHKNPMEDHPIIDTPDVSATWNLILPAFFGGDTATIQDMPEEKFNYVSQMMPSDQSTEKINMASRYPEDPNENILPNKITSTTKDNSAETRPSTIGTYVSSSVIGNTKPIPITITTEKLKDNFPSSPGTHYITTELPAQTKVTEEDNKDIYVFHENKIDTSSQKIDTSQKMDTSSQNIDTSSQITDISSQMTDTSSQMTDTSSQISDTSSQMTDTPAQEIDMSSQMIDTSSQIIDTSSQMIDTSSQKIDTSSQIIDSSSPKIETSSQMIDTSSQNIDTSSQNIDTSSQKSSEETAYTMISSSSSTSPTGNNKINSFPDITERINLKNKDEMYPKITELVSMITRPTTKGGEKTTASVTFPPTSQFTHSTQISQTSVTLKPVSISEKNTETPPTTSSDIINDNFAGLTFNNNDTDTNLEQDLNNETSHELNEGTQLDITQYDIIADVEQILENVTQKVLAEHGKVPIENYNAAEKIEDLLKKPDLNKTVTVASSIINSNKISSTTAPTTTTVTTTNKQEILSMEESTSGSTTSTQTAQKQPSTTTQQNQILTTTSIPYLKENTKSTAQEIKTILTKSTTVLPLTTKNITTSKITTTYTAVPLQTKIVSKISSKIPESATEMLLINRFKEPLLTTMTRKPTTQTITTKLTTKPLLTSTAAKLNTTTEKITTYQQTTATVITEKPTTNVATFITNLINNTTRKVTPIITTRKPTVMNTATIRTTKPITVTTKLTSTTISVTPTTILSTTQTSTTSTEPPTTISVANASEPYRKTEEFIQPNKIAPQGDTWKLVDTVKPPEYAANKMPNNTPKPIIEPFQPQLTFDMSTQGNFGMSGLNEDMLMFHKLYNELALKFWSVLALRDISSERSAVVSPFGIISMLGMIFLGARGGTSGEMNDVLRLDDILTFNPHLVFKEVTEAILSRKSTSVIVRELYTDSYRGKVQEFYRERVRQFYDGYVEEVDFKKIHNVIRRRTNALISKQTRGQMPQYVEETTLTLRAPLSALSTNIFQADCSLASTEGRDGELYFIVLPSIRQRRLIPIPAAVWRTGFIAGYDPELDATAVSLGTMNQAISTVFVMPGQQGHSAPGDVLLRLEARLLNTTYMPEMWTQLLKSMLPRPGLEVQLPRFLHKSVINTTDALKRMGLNEMFNKNKADFRGINGVGHDLYMSDVMQSNEFSICGESQQIHAEIYPSVTEYLENHNEQMRNFKYVDYFEENEYDKYLSIPLPLRPRQARLPEIPRLRFDRPFLYFVRHNPTGLLLHMGRFNPRLLT